MKRAFVISAALALLVGVVFLAVNMGGGSTVRGQEEPTPTPTPTPTPLPAECDIGVVAPGIVASTNSLVMKVGDPPAVVDLTATFKNNGAVTQGVPDETCSFARVYAAEIGTGDILTDTPVDPTKLGVRVEPYGATTPPYGDVCIECSPANKALGWTAAQCLQGHGMGDYYPTPPPPWDYYLMPCDEQTWPAALPFSMTAHSCEDGLDNLGSEAGTCDWGGFSKQCVTPTTADATCLDVPLIGLIPLFRAVLAPDATDTTAREVKIECREPGTYSLVLAAGVGKASTSTSAPYLGPNQDPNQANDIATTVVTVTCIDWTPTPTPTPTLSPFTPTFSYTFDEVAPDDLEILPADDECPVGAPCKDLWRVEIPDGQPNAAISGVFLPSAIVSFADAAVVPDGAILGKVFGSMRLGPPGKCATEGVITPWEVTYFDATMDPSTTTGSPSDLCSFSNWPTQLNGTRDSLLAANPGAVLSNRWVGCTPNLAINTLFFAQPDGSTFYIAVPTGPSQEVCGPEIINSVALGVSGDNPDTPEDEGGIPLRTCIAPGTHTITVNLDRYDTPPGDLVVLQDTAVCSPNTSVGSGVSVPLNGGTGLLGGIDLTFSEVSSGGSTSVITTTAGPPPPTGFKIVGLSELPLYFDINTDASYSGELTVCIRYDESQVAGPESNLKLMHHLDEGFVDITTSVDTANDIICGTTTHLSIFVVAEPLATPTPTPTPTRPHGVGGTVKLPPAAIAAESGARAEGSGWGAATYAALTGSTIAVAAAAWFTRRRWLR